MTDIPRCHFCEMPVSDEAGPIMRSKTGDALAHFECWYEGAAFHPEDRDPQTGKFAPLTRTSPA